MKTMIIKTAFLILILASCSHGKAQVIDTVAMYQRYCKKCGDFPPQQTLSHLILKSDSTYYLKKYIGDIDDNKTNYRSWIIEEKRGTWKKEKKTLTILHGSFKSQFNIRKKYIKYKRFQCVNGSKTIKYQKWILEKRLKYKLVDIDSNKF